MAVDKIVGGGVILAAVGLGAAVLGPTLARTARPVLIKALVRAMALARTGQAAIESAWEDMEDVLAEAAAQAADEDANNHQAKNERTNSERADSEQAKSGQSKRVEATAEAPAR